jgi:hypothetical protein
MTLGELKDGEAAVQKNKQSTHILLEFLNVLLTKKDHE